MNAPHRLRLDSAALVANWRALANLSGTACGAAIKADGYGLGAVEVARRLAEVGCRDFFVSTWAEAEALAPLGLPVAVLHGVREEDMTRARQGFAWPVLNTERQVARWRDGGGARCDVMVDTGMNRLGITPAAVSDGTLDGLEVGTLMSHLASADEDSDLNARQLAAFAALAGNHPAQRMSLANSAAIGLGRDYAFDLTRPGLALYGGVPRTELAGVVRQVVTPEAQILQRRRLQAGDVIGYNALFTATDPTEVAILNLGYADGYWRGFSQRGAAFVGPARLPVLGRVSMDLTAIRVDAAPDLAEGDWVAIDYALPEASALPGMSQYELLTGLGRRYDRVWTG
jgi:alanine racemase